MPNRLKKCKICIDFFIMINSHTIKIKKANIIYILKYLILLNFFKKAKYTYTLINYSNYKMSKIKTHFSIKNALFTNSCWT